MPACIWVRICSYRKPQRYIARRLFQACLPAFEKEWPEVQVEIEEISDVQEILKYTPVIISTSLVINERLVCTGRTPKKEEVLAWLEEAAKLLMR